MKPTNMDSNHNIPQSPYFTKNTIQRPVINYHKNSSRSLDIRRALVTLNILAFTHKLHQTDIPNIQKKSVTSYIKGRKWLILYNGAPSPKDMLSPTILNLLTHSTYYILSLQHIKFIVYADDKTALASYTVMNIAQTFAQQNLTKINL